MLQLFVKYLPLHRKPLNSMIQRTWVLCSIYDIGNFQFSGANWRFGRFNVQFLEVQKVQGLVFSSSTQRLSLGLSNGTSVFFSVLGSRRSCWYIMTLLKWDWMYIPPNAQLNLQRRIWHSHKKKKENIRKVLAGVWNSQ